MIMLISIASNPMEGPVVVVVFVIVQNNFGPKKSMSKKSLGKKSYVSKRFGPKTMLFKESMFQKFRSEKIMGPKNYVYNNFW